MVYAVAIGACGFPRPADVDDDASPKDAGICFGSFQRVCLHALPTQAIQFDGVQRPTIDTTNSPMCVPTDRSEYCVVAGTSITIDGEALALRATGTRPLVLIATENVIALTGIIDVGSHRESSGIAGAGAGAGANPDVCMNTRSKPTSGGGGAGGSFAGRGGAGGASAIVDSTGGAPEQPTKETNLRGGCPGQDGAGSGYGSGGAGGGAILVIAGGDIIIGDRINAAGEGGAGATPKSSGGGGGGAGGMIVLDAPMIRVTGRLIANGGGGGEGSGDTTTGNRGSDSLGIDAALGGAGASIGGDGGNGSAGAAAGDGNRGSMGDVANPGNLLGGGGGGGGGAGIIAVPSSASLSDISPAATLFVRPSAAPSRR